MLRKVALLEIVRSHLLTRVADWQSKVIINKSLTFKEHFDNLFRKAQYELHALQGIREFLTVEKTKNW